MEHVAPLVVGEQVGRPTSFLTVSVDQERDQEALQDLLPGIAALVDLDPDPAGVVCTDRSAISAAGSAG